MVEKYISTWICIDGVEDASYFPSSKGLSSDRKVQNIYWKCVLTFFTSVQKNLSGEKLILFTNTRNIPVVDGINIAQVLAELRVEVTYVPFSYKVPKGYFNSWTNQFFEFSILDFIAQNFEEKEIFLMLDSDCVFNNKVEKLFEMVRDKGCITYTLDYPEDEIINGISRREMREVYETLLHRVVEEIPVYHAGEFFMAEVSVIKKFSENFRSIWPSLLNLHKEGKKKLVEEAHVLSLIYYINDIAGGEANEFIKRMWTDPTNFRNVLMEDQNFAIWHVPAEKKYGIEKLFQIFKSNNFDSKRFTNENYSKMISHELGVPAIPFKRKVFFTTKGAVKKMYKLFKTR